VVILPDVGGTRQLEAYSTDQAETFGYRQCVSIMQAVEIDSNGDLSPCRDYHDYSVGNIRDQFIPDLWNNEKYRHFRQSLACDGLMPACRRCCGLMGF
jgi:radical SAM protein with 4Fe4S-binding SPASM domain